MTISSLVPLPFLNPGWTSGSSRFMYCWGLAWRILSITLRACGMSAVAVVGTFFGAACLWGWNQNWFFPVLWPLLSFPICWHTECSTFISSSFRIWNSSTGIPSPLLALFIMMLPMAHLTSHSRMSGSRWVITPLWLSWSWRCFLYSSSLYLPTSSYYLLLLLVQTISVFYCAIFSWNVLMVSLIFLKRTLIFPILLFSSASALITEEGFLFSPCYSLKLCIQMGISFCFSFAFRFSSFHSYL